MSKLRFDVVQDAFKKRALDVTAPAERPSAYFGELVFNREKMRKYLDVKTYEALVDCIDNGRSLDLATADKVAEGMKEWALEHGVTHITHWFQPLTEVTAEKHDSLMEYDRKGGMIESFNGKSLIQQEPDASSFPSGGIRATFEARGYTAWDPTSPVFIQDDTLCIPTVFISYTGEALDYKTPLKKALKAVSDAAVPICKLFDPKVSKVHSYLGWEQEYFLVDEDLYAARPDLILTGRTLMGHASSKNQQLEDHYFAAIPTRVAAFMKDLEYEGYKLGIPLKTRHNEVAPNQFELAPIFGECNLSNDQNQMIMNVMNKVARKHGFVVLLHEKPFDGINGSGKHNNWSISTNTGENLLSPGKHPETNTQFLLFLAAVVKAVDEYQDLLRITVASAGNDHRLGANEAPPAIISMYLGDDLDALVHSIINGEDYHSHKAARMQTGVGVLTDFKMDNSDRNRTSPFAFTGNKFEFRALGSSLNIGCPNYMLNTMVAEELSQFYDRLKDASDLETAAKALIKDVLTDHQRIIFNGDNYSDEWVQEAERRGLLNLKTLPDAFDHFLDEKNIRLFTKNNIYSEGELRARCEIEFEMYAKQINIEALTMLQMARRDIMPAVSEYIHELSDTAVAKWVISHDISIKAEEKLIKSLSKQLEQFSDLTDELSEAVTQAASVSDPQEKAHYYQQHVLSKMNELRKIGDSMETDTAKKYWPYPSYTDLLFGV